ncbi:MAG: hypothetical protein ACOCQD_00905 [archaeon]
MGEGTNEIQVKEHKIFELEEEIKNLKKEIKELKNVENAQISDVKIIKETKHYTTILIDTKRDSLVQGFGTYNLSEYARLGWFIQRIMDTLEVSDWNQIKGKIIRIYTKDTLIKGIGHPIKDQWFLPEDEWNDIGGKS